MPLLAHPNLSTASSFPSRQRSMVKKALTSLAITALSSFAYATTANAALLTFDQFVGGTSASFDGDGDGIADVIFSTPDPAGFHNVGPGQNQVYIDEPGLEGTTSLPVDLRVDFLVGARNFLQFGFALDEFGSATSETSASFKVYDTRGTLLASAFELGTYSIPGQNGSPQSTYPEGFITTNFSGVAAYALFNFSNSPRGGQRYIIDNFEGDFGTTEVSVPEPSSPMGILAFGAFGIGCLLKKINLTGRKKFKKI